MNGNNLDKRILLCFCVLYEDIEEPESGDYCLSFTFRTRHQWFNARINRNCQAVKILLDIWLTSSYVYMGIGTGAAQREGDLTKGLFKYVNEAPVIHNMFYFCIFKISFHNTFN